MVKWACDPGLLLVQAAWKNLTWESWIAKCRGPPTLPLRFGIFKCRKGRYWLEPEDCLRHRFELLEIIICHVPYCVYIFLTFLLNKKPVFSSYCDKLYNKKRRLSEKNPHTLGTYPRFPFPTVYEGGIPESLGLPGAHRLPRVFTLLHGGDGGWKQGWKIRKWPPVERISS